jgi:hypothetical protein
MRVVFLYQPNSEYARIVEEYVHDFTHGHPDRSCELMSLSTREGADMARLYDIVAYPAILAVADSGELLKDWQGPMLPPISNLLYYDLVAHVRIKNIYAKWPSTT